MRLPWAPVPRSFSWNTRPRRRQRGRQHGNCGFHAGQGRGGPAISSVVLLYPVTDANFDTASYEEFADGFLTRDAMKWFWDNYLPDIEARRHPHASPLQAAIEQLHGLPPALVMTCELDVLRDEGEAYARKLAEAGVRVASMRFIGAIHICLTLGPLANTPAVRAAVAAVNTHLREAFSH